MRAIIRSECFRPVVVTLESEDEVEIMRTLLGFYEESLKVRPIPTIPNELTLRRVATLHEMRRVFEQVYWKAHFYEKE